MGNLDFKQIRAVNGDQKHGFEELVCQLARLSRPDPNARFFRGEGRGGDGGVEAYWTLTNGTKVGYQAKYHPDGNIDWGKLDSSVRTAMKVHPTIHQYVIALPCNLTPPTGRGMAGTRGRPQKSGKEYWDGHLAEWTADFPNVQFERWDETELIARLTRPDPETVGLRAWFFDLPDWTVRWFRGRFEIATADLRERYHAGEHVRISVTDVLEGLARTSRLREILEEILERSWNIVRRSGDQLNAFHHPIYAAVVEAFQPLREFSGTFPEILTDSVPLADWRQKVTEAHERVERIGRDATDAGTGGILDWLTMVQVAVSGVSALDSLPAFLAEEKRALLVTGAAGIGKSHLLAEFADRMTQEGYPVLLVPGQWLNASVDIWGQIKARWDVERFSTEQVLGALNSAAEAANRRAMVLIDAVNESGNAGDWRRQLAGLVTFVLSYPCIGIAISCRDDYLDWVVPEELRESFLTVECHGFVSEEEQEQAARLFLDRNGIARPAMPWLAPDFTNPLFLRVTVEGLRAKGKTVYPQFVGLPGFIGLFLESLSKRPPFDMWEDSGLLRRCLRALAGAMVKKGRAWLSMANANTAICEALSDNDGDGSPGRANRLLADLKHGALLSLPDPMAKHSVSNLVPIPEGVIFAFQRLGDLLMAEVVLDAVEAAAFAKGGALACIGADPKAWAGLFGALSILLPEQKGQELLDVVHIRRDPSALQRQFRDSLLWRSRNAFLPATEAQFRRLDGHDQLEVLLRLAVVPDHPWNAAKLDRRLRPLTLAERDAEWSIPLALAENGADVAVNQLIEWALGDNCLKASDETLGLTTTVLAWMLTTTARKIRDRATKALSRIFLLRPVVMASTLDRFHVTNDPYVVERLWAAAYGAAMNAARNWPLSDLAAQTWRLCFKDGQPPISLLSRDHALGIIELAAARVVLPKGVDEDRCRPPFRTSWPLENVGKELVDAQRNENGAWDVATSVTFGDFGRYELESALGRWACAPLNAPAPQSGEEALAQFLARHVTSGSPRVQDAWTRYEEDCRAAWISSVGFLSRESSDDSEKGDAGEGADDAIAGALAKFLAELPEAATEEAALLIDARSKRIATYDCEKAKAWVVKRVLDLGWTAERFRAFEKPLRDIDRQRPKLERIGKKYQWIALDELLARLSDNVHHIGRWPERAAPYRAATDQPFFRDCDPSIFRTSVQSNRHTWWLPEMTALSPIPEKEAPRWMQSNLDVLCSTDLFDRCDADGKRWLLLFGFIQQEDRHEAKTRESWSRITTVMVPKTERDQVLDALQDRHLSDPSGHHSPEFTDDGFLGEYPWRDVWSEQELEPPELCPGIPLDWLVIRYSWEAHLDLSLNGVSCHLPSQWLCSHMGLEPKPGVAGMFIGQDGEVVFQDPAVGSDHSSVALIDHERFLAFLESDDWDCLWLVGGEKNWWPAGIGGHSYDQWACRYHAGVFWWEKGSWQSRTWSDFQSKGI